MKIKTTILSFLLPLAVGCTTSGGSVSGASFSSSPVVNAAPPPAVSADPGAQAFLARSGFLGFASINDRAIGQNRFLAYHSRADLLPEDKNGIDDIYLRDTKLGTTILVSKATDGTQGNAASTQASISADGRFVVYRSAASNLVAGDTNGTEDIFHYNVVTGVTSRVSVGAAAAESNGTSLTPAVSGDGRYVVFASEATNLVATDTNAQPDIFVRDTVSDTTSLISSNSALLDSANGASFDPAITPDGAFIALSTESTNILASALNGTRQVVRIERATPANRVLVSQTGGTQANGPCYEPSISNDGNIIAFFTNASNLAADTNTFFDVYVRNISGATTTRASLDSGGGESDGHSGFPSISGDGSILAFGSLATDLVAGDTNGVFDVFSRQASTTTRVSVTTAGAEANVDSDLPAVSLDGRYVAFRSAASNLDGNDTSFDDDIFIRDITTPTTVLQSTACRVPAVFAGFSAGATTSVVGGSPVASALGDFNGDDNLDAVSISQRDDNISLVLGDGLGGLSAATNFTAGTDPSDVVTGDFNGDGDLDIAVANESSANVSILLGDGAGGLGAATNFAVSGGAEPLSIATADFNEDGDLDLATANDNSDNVSLLFGDGTGSFGVPTNLDLNFFAPEVIKLGDFNGDNNVDLAVLYIDASDITIALGTGAGTFGAPLDFPVDSVLPESLVLDDFNKDGNLDAATLHVFSDIDVLLGDGTGNLGTPTTFDSGGTANVTAKDLVSADIDGDGRLDLLTSVIPNLIALLTGDGGGGFSAPNLLSFATDTLKAGDFDNDSFPDLFLADGFATGNASILLNQRPDWPGLAAPVATATTDRPLGVITGDINGDGTLDLAFSNENDQVTLLLNEGSGSYTEHPNSPLATGGVGQLGFADLDGDGDLDLLGTRPVTNDLVILINSGTGTYAAHASSPIALGTFPARFDLADIDADGDLDLAVANPASNNVSLLLNNGAGLLTAHPSSPLSVGMAPSGIALADMDGDGDSDLCLTNNGDSQIAIHDNNGSGTFGAPTTTAIGAATNMVVADFDGDGDLDVLNSNDVVDTLTMSLNDGTGSFPIQRTTATFETPIIQTTGDLDGDGDIDAVVIAEGGNIRVLLNDGCANLFTVDFAQTSQPSFLTLGDLDGDGDLDFAVPDLATGNIATLLNQACP